MDAMSDYFQSLMYQYLLSKRVRKLIDESGLSDRVAFLVTADPLSRMDNGEGSDEWGYNFGEGFDETHFLRQGYRGRVAITFIYLDKIEENQYLTKQQDYSRANRYGEIIKEKVLYPLHQEIDFGDTKNEKDVPLIKNCYVYVYDVNDENRKIAIDLFRKQLLTDRADKPDYPGWGDVFSLQHVTREETQAFHFLDIMAKQGAYTKMEGRYMAEQFDKKDGKK